MKLIKPLWSDPVGWVEQVAKTKLRVFLWILIHTLFVAIGLVGTYTLLQKADVGADVSPYLIPALAAPVVIIGIYYPAMYLYAMYRLLKIVKEARPNERIPA
ncbi:MAG TPA: hypothetical protein VKV04_25315 [Verrucomicrobiae bacterium]|nr:hypothetical protein [Verrucomicrobiae bacterium]